MMTMTNGDEQTTARPTAKVSEQDAAALADATRAEASFYMSPVDEIRVAPLNTRIAVSAWAALHLLMITAEQTETGQPRFSRTDIATYGTLRLFTQIFGKDGLALIKSITDEIVDPTENYRQVRGHMPRVWTQARVKADQFYRSGQLAPRVRIEDIATYESTDPFRAAEFNGTIGVTFYTAYQMLGNISGLVNKTAILEHIIIQAFVETFGKADLHALNEVVIDVWTRDKTVTEIRNAKPWKAWVKELERLVEDGSFTPKKSLSDLLL